MNTSSQRRPSRAILAASLLTLALSGFSAAPSAQIAEATSASPLKEADAPAIRVGPYHVKLVSLKRGKDGDWETTWSVTNKSRAATTVNLSHFQVGLLGEADDSSTASGPYYYPDETERRVRRSGFEIGPGEETKIRLWHSASKDMKPASYRFSALGKTVGADIPPAIRQQ